MSTDSNLTVLHLDEEELDVLRNLVAEDTTYHINEEFSETTPEWYKTVHKNLMGKIKGAQDLLDFNPS